MTLVNNNLKRVRLKRRDFRFDKTLNGYMSKNKCMVVGSREELFEFPYIKDYEFTDLN